MEKSSIIDHTLSVIKYRFIIFISLGILILSIGCSSFMWNISNEINGEWESSITQIQVRSIDHQGKYHFTKLDHIPFSLKIENSKTASGKIGNAVFTHALIEKNKGLPPSITGIESKILCGNIGKISNLDPLNSKKVELWLIPIAHSDTLMMELRYMDEIDAFPMAGIAAHRK